MKAATTLLAIFILQSLSAQECVDIDGNVYGTVAIGTQLWMQENLTTARYANGDVIPSGIDDASWETISTGAFGIYDESAAYEEQYGKLYNWFAIMDARGICPVGWHMPSDEEWQVLEAHLGMPQDELGAMFERGAGANVGGQMKTTTDWQSPNSGADNSSGFTGTPGGYRLQFGDYTQLANTGNWWTTDASSNTAALRRTLSWASSGVYRFSESKNLGASCRCIYDDPIGMLESSPDGAFAVTLFPNPTCGQVCLTYSKDTGARSASVTNTLGQPIQTLPLNGNQRQTIDLSPYENGVYFVEVRYADGRRAVERIVKQ